MFGYNTRPEAPKENLNTRKVQLLIQNIENTLEILKEELDVSQSSVISFEDMVKRIESEIDETEYEEED